MRRENHTEQRGIKLDFQIILFAQKFVLKIQKRDENSVGEGLFQNPVINVELSIVTRNTMKPSFSKALSYSISGIELLNY